MTTLVNLVFVAALPLFVISFCMITWSFCRGWLSGHSVDELQGSLDALGKSQKGQRREPLDPAMRKWLSFGGGFYGLVALYTWLIMEWPDLANFLNGMHDLLFSRDIGAIFRLVLQLFIDSFINFGLAIGWPAYWLSWGPDAWLMLPAAYAGYWSGLKSAQIAWDTGWSQRQIDKLPEALSRWLRYERHDRPGRPDR